MIIESVTAGPSSVRTTTVQRHWRFIAGILWAAVVLSLNTVSGIAGTLTLQTNSIGSTPRLLAYNLGHYYPGSNTRDWFRYAGVSGARIFISPSYIEPSDALPPWGDGVTDQTSFLNRKAMLRANPLNTNFINWASVTNRYATAGQIGNDIVGPSYAISELSQLGIQVLVVSTASQGKFTNVVAWGDKWELWHFYYEQAFYLGMAFGVQRYQMYNEPNATSLTQTDFVARLELASDAVQSAVADVNSMYGKTLTPMMFAPVTAGNATNHYFDWGLPVVTNRHINFLGQSNASYELIQDYDYHEYGGGGTGPGFGTHLIGLEADLTSTMSPETPFPISISEFNVYDGSDFHDLTSTLDTPANYSNLGSVAVNLIERGGSEIYCFKFSQTFSTYIAKNGMHYVDNDNAPYNIGGITKAGEAWRLVNKGLAPGRTRLNFTADAGASGLDVQASYDPATQRYYLVSVNNSTTNISLTANLSALNLPTNNQVLVEEVSENCYGAGALWMSVGVNQTISGTQPSNSVWLFTMPSALQTPLQNIFASDDATVTDGANKSSNFGAKTNLLVANNSTNASLRSAAFIKFQLPAIALTNLQFAILSLHAAETTGSSNAQAHIYGLANNNWSQSTITWSNAPNLVQGRAPGTNFTNNYLMGVGDNLTNSSNPANSAQMLGQLVAGPASAERIIDVTDFLRHASGTNVSFLLVREVRFTGDTQDGDGISIVSTEGNSALSPHLELAMTAIPPVTVISNLAVAPRPHSAIITWNTSSNSTSQVFYGTTPAYGSMTPLDPTPVTNHAVLLVGLASNTVYYFNVSSAINASQVTSNGTFTTDNTIIVQSSQADYTGVWINDSSGLDRFSPTYKYAATVTTNDSAEATFRPAIIVPAAYDVSYWYSEGPTRSAVAPVTVAAQSGNVSTTLNETLPGGSWELIASNELFAAGTNGFLRVGNGTGETTRIVIADAARWSYSPGQDEPVNGNVPAWWNTFYFGSDSVNSSFPGANGYSLLNDYILGISPLDPNTFLNFNIKPAGKSFQAVFSPFYSGGRLYQLQAATNLHNPVWTNVPNLPVTTNSAGQGVIALTNTVAVHQIFYRLSVAITP